MKSSLQFKLNFNNPDKDLKTLIPSRRSREEKSKYIRTMKTERESRSNDNFQFAQIVKGEFRVKVTKETEGAEMRENKNGDEVYETITNKVSGVFLHRVEVAESEYGKQLKIFLRDEDAKEKFFVIQVPLNSGYAYSFLNRANNIDHKKPILVKVFDIENVSEKDGKTYKTKTLTIAQDGQLIAKSWNEETGIPKAEPIVDKKGKPVVKNGFAQFNYDAKEQWLEKYVDEVMTPVLMEATIEIVKKTSINDIADGLEVEGKTIDKADLIESENDLGFN